MSSEVSLSSVGFDEFDRDERSRCSSDDSQLRAWRESIFAEEAACRPFSKTAILNGTRSDLDQKIQKLTPNKNTVKPMGAGGSGSVEIDISWGSGDGVEVTFGGKAEAHDDNGNYVEVKAEQSSDGSGKVNISAGHEEK
jgi:hypothetical protein